MNLYEANRVLRQEVDDLCEAKKLTPAKVAKIKKWMQVAAKQMKTSQDAIKKLVRKMVRSTYHPNKIAFDFVFPRARKFDFASLDFQHTDDMLKDWGVTKRQKERYLKLKYKLQQIDNITWELTNRQLKEIYQ